MFILGLADPKLPSSTPYREMFLKLTTKIKLKTFGGLH